MTIEGLHIALSFDEGYIAFVYTLMNSVFLSNDKASITFHAIAPDVSATDKQALCEFVAQRNGQLFFYDLNSSVITQEFVVPDSQVSGLTIAAYYRIFFPRLVPEELSKLLYIDIDTLVLGDLRELFEINLGGFAIGAVKDIEMHVRTDLGIANKDDYFNSGVLLIDLYEWRKQQITEKACDVIAHHSEMIKQWADQDVLNIVFKGKWYRLDWRFNVMKGYIPIDLPRQRYKSFLENKVIIHYNGSLKAWHRFSESKFRYLYPLYLIRSAHSTKSGYADRKLSAKALAELFRNRVVEIYFNAPVLGKWWRGFKAKIS